MGQLINSKHTFGSRKPNNNKRRRTTMSKRELAQIIEQQEWHDPRMWESNGDGVLVRKKKKKSNNEETNYLCDARSRDDDDSDCNTKVTKSTERIIANESTATCLRTTRRTKRTTGKQEE